MYKRLENFWLINDDMTRFIRFAVWMEITDGQITVDKSVTIDEYRVQTPQWTVGEPECCLEPMTGHDHYRVRFTREQAEDIWINYVRDGFRMLTEVIGKIEAKEGFDCCWLTLRSASYGATAEKVR